MPLSNLFFDLARIFGELQVWTGLSAPALLWLLLSIFRSAKKAAAEGFGLTGILAHVLFAFVFWWLVGYLLINPLWNMLISRI